MPLPLQPHDVPGGFALAFLALFAAAFVVAELVFLLLRRLPYALYMLMLALLFGLTVALYLQGNYLCLNNDVLGGGMPQWNAMARDMLVNLAIWAGILLISVSFMLLKPKLFLKAVSFVNALILVMEGSC